MTQHELRRPKLYLAPQGFVKAGFDPVWDAFKDSLDSGVEAGGSFAAYHKGELVVNIWGGWADKEARRMWKKDSTGIFFSTTKSASSIVIAHLVDRGLLNYEDRIAKHWPEFAQNGKGDITLQTYISNRSGLAELQEPYHLSWLRDDPQHLSAVLERATPLWEPGRSHGYHPITFALYLDQIVRRVDPNGRSLAQYFHEEIAVPFDIDFSIGMPKQQQYRTSRVNIDLQELKNYYSDSFSGDPEIFRLTLHNPVELRRTHVVHDPDYQELPCGSSHGVGTAEAVAKLHSLLADGSDGCGRTLISRSLIERLQVPLSWGADLTYGNSDIYSLGLSLLPVIEDGQVHYVFGHGGFGGQMGGADTKHRVGFAYVTNFLDPLTSSPHHTSKWLNLYNKLFECVLKIEGSQVERRTYRGFCEDVPALSKL